MTLAQTLNVYLTSDTEHYTIEHLNNSYSFIFPYSFIVSNAILFIIILMATVRLCSRNNIVSVQVLLTDSKKDVADLRPSLEDSKRTNETETTSIKIRLARIKMYAGKTLAIYGMENAFWRNCFEKIMLRERGVRVTKTKISELFGLLEKHLGLETRPQTEVDIERVRCDGYISR